MKIKLPKYPRVLAIALSAAGFGLAAVEGVNSLIGWEAKRVRKDMNNGCMAGIRKAVTFYQPHVIVMEEATHRSARVCALMKRITALAKEQGMQVTILSREQVRGVFFAEGLGTKDSLAAILADRFPEELKAHLPPVRKEWMSEHHRMAMFTAVALALAFRPNQHRSTR